MLDNQKGSSTAKLSVSNDCQEQRIIPGSRKARKQRVRGFLGEISSFLRLIMGIGRFQPVCPNPVLESVQFADPLFFAHRPEVFILEEGELRPKILVKDDPEGVDRAHRRIEQAVGVHTREIVSIENITPDSKVYNSLIHLGETHDPPDRFLFFAGTFIRLKNDDGRAFGLRQQLIDERFDLAIREFELAEIALFLDFLGVP